jgi:hypothetical protein
MDNSKKAHKRPHSRPHSQSSSHSRKRGRLAEPSVDEPSVEKPVSPILPHYTENAEILKDYIIFMFRLTSGHHFTNNFQPFMPIRVYPLFLSDVVIRDSIYNVVDKATIKDAILATEKAIPIIYKQIIDRPIEFPPLGVSTNTFLSTMLDKLKTFINHRVLSFAYATDWIVLTDSKYENCFTANRLFPEMLARLSKQYAWFATYLSTNPTNLV